MHVHFLHSNVQFWILIEHLTVVTCSIPTVQIFKLLFFSPPKIGHLPNRKYVFCTVKPHDRIFFFYNYNKFIMKQFQTRTRK